MPQIPTEFLNQISVILEVIVAALAATLVAFWVGLALWTLRDIHARTRDLFAWVLATLLVLITGPIGLLLYLLLRPRETLAEVYDRQLEEEALLRDITARRACPGCQTVTEPEWLVCPRCRTELRRKCFDCGRPLDLDWVMCPWCGAEAPLEQPAPQPLPQVSLPARPARGAQPVRSYAGQADEYGEPMAQPVEESPAA